MDTKVLLFIVVLCIVCCLCSAVAGGAGYYYSQGDTDTTNISVSTGTTTKREITLYENCDYGGKVVGATSGYTASNTVYPSTVDPINSIKISPGCKVEVYETPNFGGKSKTYTQDVPCLATDGVNYAVASYKFTCS